MRGRLDALGGVPIPASTEAAVANSSQAMEPSEEVLKDLHFRMVRIRHFEEEAGRLMEQGKSPGALHLYIGEEAVASGVMVHLGDDDQITSTHRGHGHLVAKGGEFKLMYAELFGRETGYNKGRGGSMHISNVDAGMLGANGIVAAGPPIAVGAAFSNKYLARVEGRDAMNVAVPFFGDGATNEGAFHEAANMAAVWNLPVVFVCENNGFGEFTRQEDHQAISDIADRAAGYGMPGVICDGMDAVAVWEAAGEAIARARAGGGPTLVECKTYRFVDHVGLRGIGLHYRTDEELEEWRARDPIAQHEARLIEMGVMTADEIQAVHDAVMADITESIEFAENSPLPDPADLLNDVYTPTAAS